MKGSGESSDGGAEEEPNPAFQIIVLGSGGGPAEDNVSGVLVRSTSTQWTKGSLLAVDAGVHLSAIIRILDEHLPRAVRKDPTELDRPGYNAPKTRNASASQNLPPLKPKALGYFAPVTEARGTRAASPAPQAEMLKPKLVLTSGPFTDLMVPYETARANAAYLLRNLISTYLITHPHLDHLSGFVVNTAGLQHTSRPKKLAALPSTIDAIKTHIFNDVVWPNLSDEDGGVGFVSYQRLIEGGNVALGDGEGRGYIEVCDGLAVKCWSVSHGHCMRRHSHHSTISQEPSFSDDRRHSRRISVASVSALRRTSVAVVDSPLAWPQTSTCVIDSSAFFIRDEGSGNEVLIFGDVEPDSISLSPRTARVWTDAAPKVASGLLKGIFIECSYDNSQTDETLFGHLAPRHLIAELVVLANQVTKVRRGSITDTSNGEGETQRKRKRLSNGSRANDDGNRRSRYPHRTWRPQGGADTQGSGTSPTTKHFVESPTKSDYPIAVSGFSMENPGDDSIVMQTALLDGGSQLSSPLMPPPPPISDLEDAPAFDREQFDDSPLRGVKVVVIHVKDTLRDGPPPGEIILSQLLDFERTIGLGCTFRVAKTGDSIWL